MSDDLRDHTPLRRTVEILVLGPAGFLMSAMEELPDVVVKGRSRLEQQLRNAHTVGRFTVSYGYQDLSRRLARLAGTRNETKGPSASGPDEPLLDSSGGPDPSSTTASRAVDRAPGVALGKVPGQHAGGEGETPANLGIPDYDTLSASQVVRRLDGLGPEELEAVRRHESAGRKRRTILHRAEQLLGGAQAPGNSDAGD